MKQPTVAKIPFTKQAYEELKQQKIKFLKLRSEAMDRLKIAREQGDLSENGAYKYAKFELSDIGRQLRKLNYLLENGEVVKQSNGDTVQFGSTVKVKHKTKEITFFIVSQHESNPMENKLSMEGPLGQQLLGKKKGDSVTVQAPVGEILYEILAVE